MNELQENIAQQPKAERGTITSYVIGFLLSLVFTAIPYYLVVNKTVEGNTLLATILGFAVLQMAVQIFFFLHLGRGPKPLYNVFSRVILVNECQRVTKPGFRAKRAHDTVSNDNLVVGADICAGSRLFATHLRDTFVLG